MLLLLAVALPRLFWDGAADTAAALKDAGITQIVIPADKLDGWKGVAGVSATSEDLAGRVKLLPPAIRTGAGQASASREPWVDSNGWRFIREPNGKFYYDVNERQSALAAAEAFTYNGDALVKTNAAGLKPLGQILAFLKRLTPDTMPSAADIAFMDDGSPAAGEVINLMTRGNLMFKIVTAPDRKMKVNVQLGSKDYPVEDAKNPKVTAQRIRTNLTDEKRSLRLYGSNVVVGRLTESGGNARLQLLNYGGAARKVSGVRVRVLGNYSKSKAVADGSMSVLPGVTTGGTPLQDFSTDSNATEFTLPELNTYAVIDLSR